ncbi:hypothetical protein CDAR_304761 [Caerostris darwini]|uniref:Recombination activating protein 2 n=1 Tax=Caerostris darwini TaxID=1538125 RepID=A0AAV4PV79_9ARAC|nr:hypothetical protein CDAR_304761 [Caerostris darwini]
MGLTKDLHCYGKYLESPRNPHIVPKSGPDPTNLLFLSSGGTVEVYEDLTNTSIVMGGVWQVLEIHISSPKLASNKSYRSHRLHPEKLNYIGLLCSERFHQTS